MDLCVPQPTHDWRTGLPVLEGSRVRLREPVLSDAPSLFREICCPEVCAFVPPPPPTVAGVELVIERGIEWRRAGRGFCFGLQTLHAGELAGMLQNAGMRHAPPDITQQLLAGQDVDPSLVYFRTVPTFETSAPSLQWLTRAIFIGTGERHPNDVVIRVWRVE